MKSFRLKSKIKYELLQKLETHLAANLFATEFELLDDNRKFRVARIESYVPWIFVLLFVMVILLIS